MKITFKLLVPTLLVAAAGCSHNRPVSEYSGLSPSYDASRYDNASVSYKNSYPSRTDTIGNAGTINSQIRPDTTTFQSGASDVVLTTQIQQSLNNNPTFINVAPNIQVTAQSGSVTLSGTVPSEQQKQAVETMVRSTTGVVAVNNQLQVALNPTSGRPGEPSRIYSNAVSQADSTEIKTEGTTAGKDFEGKSSRERLEGGTASASEIPGNIPPSQNTVKNVDGTAPVATATSGSPDGQVSPSVSGSLSITNPPGSSGLSPTSDSDNSRLYSTNRSNIGDSSLSLTNKTWPDGKEQSSTIPDDSNTAASSTNLSATSDQSKPSRLYSTNAPSSRVGNSSGDTSITGDANSDNASAYIQGATEADRTLGQQVLQKLHTDTSLGSALPMIRIRIDSGKATLLGSVKSNQEKERIAATIQQVTGVTSVDNQLLVQENTTDTTGASKP